jgi:uncharacterized membrane protein
LTRIFFIFAKKSGLKEFVSVISGKSFPVSDKITIGAIRPVIRRLIMNDYPEAGENDSISVTELNNFRAKYVSESLVRQLGRLSELDKQVVSTFKLNTTITDKLDSEDDVTLSLGQKMADKVATFGGSWYFIIFFGIFLLIWILINIWWFSNKAFDPYPFILLNLILSCLAAIQAPIIMMSQNRQDEKDRERSKKDYMINLKSELEIRTLHEKIDHMIMNQQQALMNIQQVQIEMLNDIMNHLERSNKVVV